jgi:hypothetical protein
MVQRGISSLPLAAALLLAPLIAQARARWDEGTTTQDRLDTILSYSAAAQEHPDLSEVTADCRGCHEDTLPLLNRTYHAALEESCFSCHKGTAAEEHLKGQQEGQDVPGPSIEALPAEEANAIWEEYTWDDVQTREVLHYMPGSFFLNANNGDYQAWVGWLNVSYSF